MRLTLRSAAAAACVLAAAVNLNTLAHAAPDGGGECFRPPGGDEDAPHGGPGARMGHPAHGLPWGMHPASLGGVDMPPWMHHLNLSEAQQDAVFGILHAQEPTLREQFKAVRHSRDALRKAALTSGTDPALLRTLGDSAGKADADLAVLMAQTDQRLLAVLTTDQQKVVQDCLPR